MAADLTALMDKLARGETSGPPPGDIDQAMRPRTKCFAYVDLLLAPSGRAVLSGEPEAVLARLGRDNLSACAPDVLVTSRT